MYYKGRTETIESRGYVIPDAIRNFNVAVEPDIDPKTNHYVGKNYLREVIPPPNTEKKIGEVLAVNGSRHVVPPLPYRKFAEPLLDGVKLALGGDDESVQGTWTFIEGGLKMYADFILREYNFENIVGEPTALGMRIQNSIDGSLAYGISVFIVRVFCTNKMQRIAENTSVRKKHTIGADPERIARVAADWPSQLTTDAHLFNHMKKQIVSTDTIKTFLEQYLCLTKTRTQVKVNQKWLERMMVLWYDYSRGIGSNAYAFYNVLTHYGTHVDLDSGRGAAVGNRALQQERNVRTLVQGQAFKNLIDYQGFEQQQKVAA